MPEVGNNKNVAGEAVFSCDAKCRLLAQSGQSSCARVCPLLENSGQRWILARDGLSVNDPKQTAVAASVQPTARQCHVCIGNDVSILSKVIG
jgi:hypothetical protein